MNTIIPQNEILYELFEKNHTPLQNITSMLSQIINNILSLLNTPNHNIVCAISEQLNALSQSITNHQPCLLLYLKCNIDQYMLIIETNPDPLQLHKILNELTNIYKTIIECDLKVFNKIIYDRKPIEHCKGDLAVHNGYDHDVLPIGQDNQVLTVDSSTFNGISWSTLNASSFGQIGQPDQALVQDESGKLIFKDVQFIDKKTIITTDDSITTIHIIKTEINTCYMLEIMIIANGNDACVGFNYKLFAHNNNNNVTIIGHELSYLPFSDWNVSSCISGCADVGYTGQNILIQCQGALNTDITWSMSCKILKN
jgi:hypothetical protein